MKNLKKVLSLALAFAMVLGLCVTGMAAQDVTTLADWDTVTDKDSAMLLNAFEIMQGDENGFRPNDDVKRSEAAKMISVALWGGVDSASLYASGNIGAYTDVVGGAWYMGYVNYLTVTGVMTGKGEGEFDPDGEVTGYELLKMALVALGYDAEKEGLTGLGWDLRTMALATQRTEKNLTEGTTVTDWNAPLNRMNAATIIANMIYRRTVTYNATTGVAETSNILGVANPTFGVAMLGMIVVDANLIANEYGNIDSNYGATASINPTTGKTAAVYTVYNDVEYVELDSELLDLGTPVKLYYVDSISDENLVSVTLTGWTQIDRVYDSNWATTNWDDVVEPAITHGGAAYYGEETCIDFDGDNKIDLVTTVYYDTVEKVTDVVETENFGTVYAINDTKWVAKTMDKANTALPANFIAADASNIEAAKGDFIGYTTITNGFGATYTHGYSLETVEGTVTRVSQNSRGTDVFAIDGVSYTDATATTIGFGSEGTFYLWPNATVAEFVGTTSEVELVYAVVYDAAHTHVTTGGFNSDSLIIEVKAVLETGESGVYEVAKIVDNGVTYEIAKVALSGSGSSLQMTGSDNNPVNVASYLTGNIDGKMVSYVLNEDGTLSISVLATQPSAQTTAITSGTTVLASGIYATADTISFVQTSASPETWAVVKGTDILSTVDTGKSITVLAEDYLGTTDKATYVVVANASDLVSGGTTAPFFYVLSNLGQIGKTDNTSYPVYELVVYNAATGEVETIEANDGTTTGGTFDAGDYYTTFNNGLLNGSVTIADTGFITGIEAEIIEVSQSEVNGLVATGSAAAYTVDGNTKYHYIAGEDSTIVTAADIDVQDTTGWSVSDGQTDAYQAQIIVSGGVVTHVIVFADVQHS